MTNSNSNLHLTLEERKIISKAIFNGSTKSAIAEILGKDKSTIGKEIKLHRVLKHKARTSLECINYAVCSNNYRCSEDCPNYEQFKCNRRDRSPGACNGCSKYRYCHYDKYSYEPEIAEKEYKELLSDSRAGVNLTTNEAKAMAEVIQPLLKNGQSPYMIVTNHPELNICEKTLYHYIESGIFNQLSDIKVADLRRQVSRKIPRKYQYKKRVDRKYINGRTYLDFQHYIEENPNVHVTEMDTVYNNETTGPFVQTFLFRGCSVLFCILHKEKTAATMTDGVNLLESILGPEIFRKYVNVLLTDRGSEFSAADDLETSADGTRRTRVFYCDPMQSSQKGTIENKHTELRYILPKETDLYGLGLVSQEAMNTVTNHINSSVLEKFNGKSSYDVCELLYSDLFVKLKEYGLSKIDHERILLKPYLLKRFK